MAESAFHKALRYEIGMIEIEIKTVGSAGGGCPGMMMTLFGTQEQHAAAWAEYHRLVAELKEEVYG